jgi:hypothetical protein
MDVIGPTFIPGVTNEDYWSEITTEHMQPSVSEKSQNPNLREVVDFHYARPKQ